MFSQVEQKIQSSKEYTLILPTLFVSLEQGSTAHAGRIGLVIVLCGMAGSMICGVILDKTQAYK